MTRNPWKLMTIGLAAVGTTALGTGLTTAWMLRPAAPAVAQEAPTVSAPAPVVRHAGPAPAPRPARVAARPAPPAATPVASTTVATDCATGGDRAMRIARPGLVGALLGAGLGAASGAIADGGKAAGKGALIGGIAGAALGGGYGAYKTQRECGTIFGEAPAPSALPTYSVSAPQAAVEYGRQSTLYTAR